MHEIEALLPCSSIELLFFPGSMQQRKLPTPQTPQRFLQLERLYRRSIHLLLLHSCEAV